MRTIGIRTLYLLVFVLLLTQSFSYGFWVWTPHTKRFENAREGGKDTPQAQAKYARRRSNLESQLKEWQILLKRFPNSPQAAEALYNIGLIYEKMHNYYLAHRAYKKLIEKYPFSDYFSKAIEKEFDLGKKFLQGYRRKFWDITKPVENPAPEVFDLIVNSAPYSEFAPAALYYKGLYYKKKKVYDEATNAFERLLNAYPDSEYVDKAEYQIAMTYYEMSLDPQYDQAFTEKAVSAIRKFLVKYPNSSFRQRAENILKELEEKQAQHNLKIAKFYLKQKKSKAAKVYLEEVVGKYPNTRAAEEAQKLLRSLGNR